MKGRQWLTILSALVYLFLYAPIFVLILFSFDDSRLAVKWTGFTLKWYESLLADGDLLAAFLNSLKVAVIAVFFSSIMGTLASVGMHRFEFRGKGFYRALLMLPIVIPEIAMAVAALTLFIAMGLDLSLATIIVGHIVFCSAYITLVVSGRLEGFDLRLEEAAMDLGATPIQAFCKVTLPLLAPGIVAGSLLAFVLSLDDFVITQFTAGVGDTTLPLWIFGAVKFGVSPAVNALSTIMIVVTVFATTIAEYIRHRQEA